MLSIQHLEIGKTHNVWNTIRNSTTDIRKAFTKVRMITGTYMLQTLKVKFNQAELDPTCPLCRLAEENLEHVVTRCPAYNNIRKIYFPKIKSCVTNRICSSNWPKNFNDMAIICQLIVDCQMLALEKLPDDKTFLGEIESLTRDFSHFIHLERLRAYSIK